MPTKRQTASAARGNKAESTGMDAISALDLLEEDHTQVDGLFKEFEQLDNAEEKKELALKICHENGSSSAFGYAVLALGSRAT